jgi:hypothetical protein
MGSGYLAKGTYLATESNQGTIRHAMIVGSTGTGIMYRMGRCSKRKPAIRASVKYVTLTSGVGLTGLPILPMARARYNDFWLRRRGRSAERGINLKICLFGCLRRIGRILSPRRCRFCRR